MSMTKHSLLCAFSAALIISFAIKAIEVSTNEGRRDSNQTFQNRENKPSNANGSSLISLDDAAEITGLQYETIRVGLQERGVSFVLNDGQKFYPQAEVLHLHNELRHSKVEALDELDELLERWGL